MADDRTLPPPRMHVAKVEHRVAYDDLVALVRKHAGTLTGMELLAVAANLVGKLVGMQDRETVSPAMAVEVVARNVQVGNREVLTLLAGGGDTQH